MDVRNFALLVSMGAIWGSSYLFIRLAAPTFGSKWLVALRLLIAGISLLIFARLMGRKLNFQNKWFHYVLLGTINSALPFMLITNAVIVLNAGNAAIINAMTPVFTTVIAAVWIKDKFTTNKILGLVLGLTGVIVLVGWNPLPLTNQTLFACLQAIAAAVCYGIGIVYARARFSKDAPLTVAVGQVLGASVVQVPLALLSSGIPKFTTNATLSLTALAIICTALAYLGFYKLIANVGPARASTVTFLIPLFSLMWGVLLLNEKLSVGLFVGLAMILSSVGLIMRKPPTAKVTTQPAMAIANK